MVVKEVGGWVGEEVGVCVWDGTATPHAPGLRVSRGGSAHAQSMTERPSKDVVDSNWKRVRRVDRIRQ